MSSSAWSLLLTSAHRMLKPRGWLHGENVPSAPNARTRQYSDAWSPVIHGSEIGTATAGVFSERLDQMTALSAPKFRLVESSNSYRVARGTGAQAKDGVRENVGGARPRRLRASRLPASRGAAAGNSKPVRLGERRPVGRRTGGERDGRDACKCRRSDKEARTPKTAKPALDAAMIVVVHRDAVCLSLDRGHQLLPAVVAGAALVPAVKRKPYWMPVAVLVSFTGCPLRAVMVGFPLAKAPPTILRRTAFRVTATSRNWTWPILNVCRDRSPGGGRSSRSPQRTARPALPGWASYRREQPTP